MTSDFVSATVTVAGGGLLLAKNCAIMWLRNALKPTRPPTSSASNRPTMINQRTVRIGRVRGFSLIARGEMFASAAMVIRIYFLQVPAARPAIIRDPDKRRWPLRLIQFREG